ncbi:VOC family protein [Actinophytocola glycyrrhizae]|uniref:VOC family protein n=1 Tax=Actinophytocola glycyrrhizae TaxID=2044873 RepID=A0ABV9SA55_9PSEU
MTPKLDMIGLVVEDMAASLAFYRKLGLDIPDTDEPHVEATLPNGLRFGWDTVDVVRSFDPEWTKPVGGNSVGICFLCDSPAEVDKTHAALVADGYRGHKDPWDAFWGQRYASVEDPDGNVVDLFAPLGR